jgi:hypothetical protein
MPPKPTVRRWGECAHLDFLLLHVVFLGVHLERRQHLLRRAADDVGRLVAELRLVKEWTLNSVRRL